MTLIARFAGDVAFFDEVAAIFLEDYPRMIRELHDARARRDLTALRSAAHALKGAVSHFTDGLPYASAARLELLAESGQPEAFEESERVEDVLREFVAAVAAAHAADLITESQQTHSGA